MSGARYLPRDRLSRSKSAPAADTPRALALVTGATGFIGGHLVARLLERGYAVRAFCRDETKAARTLPPGVEVALGDVRDVGSLRAAMSGVDLVFHAASAMRVWGTWRAFQETTIQGTENAALAAQEAGVRRFVCFSSVAVYDDRALKTGLVRETSPLTDGRWTGAFGFYGRSKMLAERAAFRHHSEQGPWVTVLRPGWVYGPRDQTMLPYLRLWLKLPLGPWLGYSEPLMPFVYVRDVVEAAILSAETERSAGQVYNIAGPSYPLRDFLWDLCDGLGGRMPFLRIPKRLATIAALALETCSAPLSAWLPPPFTPSAIALLENGLEVDCSKAQRELEWTPRVSIAEGLEATVAWLRGEEWPSRRRQLLAALKRELSPVGSASVRLRALAARSDRVRGL